MHFLKGTHAENGPVWMGTYSDFPYTKNFSLLSHFPPFQEMGRKNPAPIFRSQKLNFYRRPKTGVAVAGYLVMVRALLVRMRLTQSTTGGATLTGGRHALTHIRGA
ncbi:hypothetical protein ACXR0O_25025 [Verrucomicrobiota bacterium sgz303538]